MLEAILQTILCVYVIFIFLYLKHRARHAKSTEVLYEAQYEGIIIDPFIETNRSIFEYYHTRAERIYFLLQIFIEYLFPLA